MASQIVLFDVDGTLTPSRQKAGPEVLDFLKALRTKTKIGLVGGSDLAKQKEQLGDDVLSLFDYVFPENGLVAFRDCVLVSEMSLKQHLGEDRIKAFINFTLGYLSTLDIPIKRGTFIEFRSGMLNVCPIGRNCSPSERDEFERHDAVHGVRSAMVAALQARFSDYGLKYSIGGQISFDVFPIGWDKTFCLKLLANDGFTDVHFWGDKTFPGGNDYEIFMHPAVKGHTTTGPADTIAQCTAAFLA